MKTKQLDELSDAWDKAHDAWLILCNNEDKLKAINCLHYVQMILAPYRKVNRKGEE